MLSIGGEGERCCNYEVRLHDTGPVASSTIPSACCAIPFTLNNKVHYNCVDNGGGVGCFYGDRQWKLCEPPAGKRNSIIIYIYDYAKTIPMFR